jgi:hypothetical protein
VRVQRAGRRRLAASRLVLSGGQSRLSPGVALWYGWTRVSVTMTVGWAGESFTSGGATESTARRSALRLRLARGAPPVEHC